MTFSLDTALMALFFILLTALTTTVTFFARILWPQLKRQLELSGRKREAELVERIVRLAVAHAEQLGESNEHKKRLAVEFVKRELAAYGIDLDDVRLDGLVEAAVWDVLNHWIGYLPPDDELEPAPVPEPG